MRFRKNVKTLPGKPDIVFPRSRIVIFCDGDFWHGRNWTQLKTKLSCGANSDYWIAKINSNILRDKKNTEILKNLGWRVIRVWESEIKTSLTEITDGIYAAVKGASPVTRLNGIK